MANVFSFFMRLGRFSPLLAAISVLIVSAFIDAIQQADAKIFIREFFGRLFGIDSSLYNITIELNNVFSIKTLISGIMLFIVMFYLVYIIYVFVKKFIMGDVAPFSNIAILTLLLFYAYLVIGAYYYNIPQPFLPLKGTWAFLSHLNSYTPLLKEQLARFWPQLSVQQELPLNLNSSVG